jgi:hypothetical protein
MHSKPINDGYSHSKHINDNYSHPKHINDAYGHPKPLSLNRNYIEPYQPQPHHDHLNLHQPQMNILQRISFIIKPQLPELKKIMSRVSYHKK